MATCRAGLEAHLRVFQGDVTSPRHDFAEVAPGPGLRVGLVHLALPPVGRALLRCGLLAFKAHAFPANASPRSRLHGLRGPEARGRRLLRRLRRLIGRGLVRGDVLGVEDVVEVVFGVVVLAVVAAVIIFSVVVDEDAAVFDVVGVHRVLGAIRRLGRRRRRRRVVVGRRLEPVQTHGRRPLLRVRPRRLEAVEPHRRRPFLGVWPRRLDAVQPLHRELVLFLNVGPRRREGVVQRLPPLGRPLLRHFRRPREPRDGRQSQIRRRREAVHRQDVLRRRRRLERQRERHGRRPAVVARRRDANCTYAKPHAPGGHSCATSRASWQATGGSPACVSVCIK